MSRVDPFMSQTGAPSEAAPQSIAPATGVGSVHLSVTDGERALAFYRDVLGLTPLSVESDQIRLGAGERELVVLHPGAERPVVEGRTGLYHLAIVVPHRRELARVIARLMTKRYPNSPTDHTMTKSDYLWDPDGNGIEVYAETPEDGTWTFDDDSFGAIDSQGNRRSGRDPIDLDELFGELRPDDRLDAPIPEGSKMGHVHLHVRDVDEALRFYHDLIGFDLTGRSRRFAAAFVSAGGYHHHLGLNMWAGAGAPPAPAGSAGLRHFTIELPTTGDLAEVKGRLTAGGVEVEPGSDADLWIVDPSGNKVLLRVRD
jgi:catechol 2,3-dioxygenase